MKNRSALVLVLATALAATSCGGSGADASLSPSAAFDARATTSTTSGTVSALVGTCPALTFALERRIIKTNAGTSFGDRACVDLKNTVRVEVTGAVQSDGSVLATRVRLVPATNVPAAPPVPAPSLVNVVGSVAEIGGVCPMVTFTIERRIFKTNASTVFGDGACAGLAKDVRVELVGSAQADGSILVVKLAVVRASPPPTTTPPPRPPTPPAPPTTGVLAGVITELAGTCPLLRINVGERTVTTSASTIFDGKACGELKVGATVEIAVALTSTNSLLVALKVASRP